jgi:hypothetical protein
MPRVTCENCGAGVDVTKDGLYGHCASCNTVGVSQFRTVDAWLTEHQIVELKKASEDKPEDKGEGEEEAEKASEPASTETGI